MSKEKQAQRISEIGEMIVEDKTYQTKPWHSLAIAITLTKETEKMSGYLYQEDGTYKAFWNSANDTVTIGVLKKFIY